METNEIKFLEEKNLLNTLTVLYLEIKYYSLFKQLKNFVGTGLDDKVKKFEGEHDL